MTHLNDQNDHKIFLTLYFYRGLWILDSVEIVPTLILFRFFHQLIAVLLVLALVAVKKQNYHSHKKFMLAALVMSIVFLVSYIAHHLLAGETKFGDINHDGILSNEEKLEVGTMRIVYYFILITHIPLAAIMLPFILFTAYRALTGEYTAHKKLVRFTWPLWFYVAFTGIMVYLMISPYYN